MEDELNHCTAALRDLLESADLQQHVNQQTHEKGHTLDLIMSSKSDNLAHDVKIHRGLPSDHSAVSCKLTVSRPPITKRYFKVRDFKNIDFDNLRADIRRSALHATPEPDVDHLATQYDQVLREIIDNHAPEVSRRISLRSNAPWFTDALRDDKRRCRQYERAWVKSRLEVHRQIFREQCLSYHSHLLVAKRDYHKSEIADCTQAQLFKVVDKISNGKSPQILPDCADNKKLANKFATYFTSKICDIRQTLETAPKDKISVSVPETCSTALAEFQHVTVDEVRKFITNSPTKSCSLDPIPTWLLKKEVLEELLPIITTLINASLSEGRFPATFKSARVVPLIKKPNADRENLKNYRPISNLSFISKVTERVVAAQLQKYLEDNRLYASKQSAYRRCHSTETALLRVTNDFLRALDDHKEGVLVLLDFSSAFDVIDQQIFLERLTNKYGITGKVHDWFASYISNRSQVVAIAGAVSDPQSLEQGLPQGSVVGPLGFAMYSGPIQDIIAAHGLNCMLYADDTQIYITSSASDRQLQLDKLEMCIKDIRAWCVENKLLLNDSKTEVIHISSRFTKPVALDHITVGSSQVKTVSKARNIGVVMDSNLQLNHHINNVCRAAMIAIRKIGQIRHYLDKKVTEKLVHAFVTSRIDSCNSILFGLPNTQIAKLQRIQNMAARLVTLTKKFDHISPVLESLHWLPVKHRVVFKVLLLTYKSLNGKAPAYLSELLRWYVPGHSGLRSRSQRLLKVPKYATVSHGFRAFSIGAPMLWNRLPLRIREAKTVAQFKSQLKTYLFQIKDFDNWML